MFLETENAQGDHLRGATVVPVGQEALMKGRGEAGELYSTDLSWKGSTSIHSRMQALQRLGQRLGKSPAVQWVPSAWLPQVVGGSMAGEASAANA